MRTQEQFSAFSSVPSCKHELPGADVRSTGGGEAEEMGAGGPSHRG